MARVLAVSFLIAIVLGTTIYMAYEGLEAFVSKFPDVTSIKE